MTFDTVIIILQNTDTSTRNPLSLVLDAAVVSVRNQLRWVGSLLATLTHFVCGCGSLLATLTHFVCGCGSLLAQAHPSLTFGFANHRRLRMVAGWRYLYF